MIINILLALFGLWVSILACTAIYVLVVIAKRRIINKSISKNFNATNDEVKIETQNADEIPTESITIEPNKNEINKQYLPNEYVAEKYAELQCNIKKYIDKSNNFPLLVVGSLVGLDANEIIGKDSNFEFKFIECSKKLTNFQHFNVITNSRITAGDYAYSSTDLTDTYHFILCATYIEKYNNFLTSFQEYFDFIEQNKELLNSKKKIYLKEDEFGDIDGSNWIDYLQRFAERRSLHKESKYPDDLEAVNNYIRILKLDNFEGKVISCLLSLWEHFEKKDDKYASVYTGVDFERYIKTLIEEQLEGSYVETTPASGDHGADLLVRFRGIVVAVQAKFYTGSVGNAAVQEIHSGMGFYDADYGMVVTQSKYTDHAKSLAMKLDIHLEDAETFIAKIKLLAS
jgi:hypothetical protein